MTTYSKVVIEPEGVLKRVVASMIEHDEPPQPSDAVQVSEPLVAVTV